MKLKKEQIKSGIILLLVTVLVIAGVYFVNAQIQNQAYSEGYRDGQIEFYNQLISQLSLNGQVYLPVQTSENQTINIRLVVAEAQ